MAVMNEGNGMVARTSYQNENYIDPAKFGFIEIDSMGNDMSGFYAQSYRRGDDIIISYRGSTRADNKSQECEDALAYYDYIRRRYPSANISLTGHSLDGAMVQYIDAISC